MELPRDRSPSRVLEYRTLHLQGRFESRNAVSVGQVELYRSLLSKRPVGAPALTFLTAHRRDFEE